MTKLGLSNEEVAQVTFELFKILRNAAAEFVCKYGFNSAASEIITLGASSELLALCASFNNDKRILDVMFQCIAERRDHYYRSEKVDMSNVYCFTHRKKR